LLPRCTSYLQNDGTVDKLSGAELTKVEGIKDRWSAGGKRVILMAQKSVPEDFVASLGALDAEKMVMDAAEGGLTLVGLVGIIDPPVFRNFFRRKHF
jgi:sodium/potassium-transporting ATPase subunit alpha